MRSRVLEIKLRFEIGYDSWIVLHVTKNVFYEEE